MAELVAVPVDGEGNGEVVVFETDAEPAETEREDFAGQEGDIARAKVTLEEALAHVRPALAKVAQTVRELDPDDTQITFGLKVGGSGTVIVAKGTTEVNFAVTLRWGKSPGPDA
ncbi:hypothetical protein ADL22_16510 [Streptomyces sp. NRRL F-4489]|uniref:CU044_2847 family protein n=1 Tax=Streptomyces sp. NRRL F-4489 TaxID=1609095 RepID=UPI0007466534|nr:CU044_2847 family protein [Streptomyces sp. NRRL F-4489]KUL38856.1 hypothetical protein ADL22_16510 [Streptomyces sp. NRRL F-4489]